MSEWTGEGKSDDPGDKIKLFLKQYFAKFGDVSVEEDLEKLDKFFHE